MNAFEQPGYGEGKALRRVQVVFVVDTTHSMGEVSEALKDEIAEVAEIYSSFRMKSEFGLIEFRHLPTDDSPYSSLRRITGGWIDDPSIFSRIVSGLVARGGGSFRESVNEALGLACDSNWDNARSTTRVIVLATDTKPDMRPGWTTETARDAFTRAGIDQFYYFINPSYADEFHIITEAKDRSGNDITSCEIPMELPLDREKIREQFREFAQHSGYSIPPIAPESNDSEDDEQNGNVVGL